MISNEMKAFLNQIDEQSDRNKIVISDLNTSSIKHQETYEEYQTRQAAKKAREDKELNDIKMGVKSIDFDDSAVETLRRDFLAPIDEHIRKEEERHSFIIPRSTTTKGIDELNRLLELEHEKLNITETRISAAMLVDDHEGLSNAVRDRDKTVETIQRYESDIEQLKQTTT